MAEYKVDLVKKIVRMLESDHEGERAAAAGKLAAMAKGQGHNLDEMMAAVYGGGAKASSSQRTNAYDDIWDNLQRAAREAQRQREARQRAERQYERDRAQRQREAQDYAREAAEQMRKAQENMNAQNRNAHSQQRDRHAGWERGFDPGKGFWDEPPPWAQGPQQAPPRTDRRFDDEKLDQLRAAYAIWGDKPLSYWERDFVNDMLNSGMSFRPTAAQAIKIEEILQKYGNFNSRNGDESAFWKSWK